MMYVDQTTGRENPVELLLPTPDSVSTICYTSGTTGKECQPVKVVEQIMYALSLMMSLIQVIQKVSSFLMEI